MWGRQSLMRLRSGMRTMSKMHDHLDHVTGIEKRELLAHLAGDCDPFRMLAIKKGPGSYDCPIRILSAFKERTEGWVYHAETRPGTYECPNLIPSAFNKRIVGCVCHPDAGHIEYMWLHMGEPKRCGCGHWFELCPIAPL